MSAFFLRCCYFPPQKQAASVLHTSTRLARSAVRRPERLRTLGQETACACACADSYLPGMTESKSLTWFARLIADAKKPPNGATEDAKTAKPMACSWIGFSTIVSCNSPPVTVANHLFQSVDVTCNVFQTRQHC